MRKVNISGVGKVRTKGVTVGISLGSKVAAVLVHIATAFDETISNDDGNSYGTQDIGARLFAKVVGELNSCSQNVEDLKDANGVGVHCEIVWGELVLVSV